MNDNPPPTGPSQHMKALQRANVVRLARSRLKAGVSGGQIEVAEVIRACPWEARSMGIGELLRSQKRWGEGRCRRFLAPTHITETKRLDSLTPRQRNELLARLGASGAPPLPAVQAA